MVIRLIIFDLDGTLIDSSKDITDAINYAITPYGLTPLTSKYTIKFVGEGISRLIEKLLSNTNLRENSAVREEILNRFLEFYSEHLLDNTHEYPGVRKTLQKLKDYKKAVISNKREAFSKKILEGLGLNQYFDLILGSDSTPEKKPSPAPIKKALTELSLTPREALIVGDSNFDIEAGQAAGLVTVAVTYGYRPIEVLKGADYVIDRIEDILNILGKTSEGMRDIQ